MVDTATQTAPAADYVEGEDVTHTDQALVKSNAQITVRHDMSPESLRTEIARQKQMTEIMVEYVRDNMKDGHHYYSFNEGGKPALTKDGAYTICRLLKVIPGPVDVEIIREEGGHFTVVSHAKLFNQDMVEIASSRGSCSTRESKYAYRWVGDKNLPDDVDKATLKSRSGTGKYGKYTQYQLPNPDLADLENTIIKMSEKRATVGAVNKLPLVSELFANDPNAIPPGQPTAKAPSRGKATQSAPAAASAPAGNLPLDDPKELAEIRADVQELLGLKIGNDPDERNEYLKGRDPDQMPLDALKKMQGDLAAM
jgi:hypothetical protein